MARSEVEGTREFSLSVLFLAIVSASSLTFNKFYDLIVTCVLITNIRRLDEIFSKCWLTQRRYYFPFVIAFPIIWCSAPPKCIYVIMFVLLNSPVW